jgi:hypothetical protein
MKKSRFGTGNEVLDNALYEEKTLTARWYFAMSGQQPWLPGEKEQNAMKTERVSKLIREEFAKQAVDWFEKLPDSVQVP